MSGDRQLSVHELCTGHLLDADLAPPWTQREKERRESVEDHAKRMNCSPSNSQHLNVLRGSIERPPEDSDDERESDWAVSELQRCLDVRKERAKAKDEEVSVKRKQDGSPESKTKPARKKAPPKPERSPFAKLSDDLPTKKTEPAKTEAAMKAAARPTVRAVARKGPPKPESKDEPMPAKKPAVASGTATPIYEAREPDNLFHEGKAFVFLDSTVAMTMSSAHASMKCEAPKSDAPTVREVLEKKAAEGTKNSPKKKKEKKAPAPEFPPGGKKKFDEITKHLKDQLTSRLKGPNKKLYNKIDVSVCKDHLDDFLEVCDRQAQMFGCVARDGNILPVNLAHATEP